METFDGMRKFYLFKMDVCSFFKNTSSWPLEDLSKSLYFVCMDCDERELVAKIIKHKIEPNSLNFHNQTPLHLASQSSYLLATICLEKVGSIVNLKDNFFRTPLFYAIEHKDFNISRFLISKGACLDDKTKRESSSYPSLNKSEKFMKIFKMAEENYYKYNKNLWKILENEKNIDIVFI